MPSPLRMQRSTIIVAGGKGERMASPVPKQFLALNGKPVLCRTIEAFHTADPAMGLVVVLPGEWMEAWHRLCEEQRFTVPHTVVRGGAERFYSVREGLAAVGHEGLVAVHDGVRPLISVDLIDRCFTAAEAHGAAIPVLPISSSVRELSGGTSRAVDRGRLRMVQTPQCFRVSLLRQAFQLPYDPAFTDEATLVERAGAAVHLVEGEERNMKVTTPFDLRMAAAILEDGE